MNFPGGWELVLILLVVLVVFGSKRLPDSARALGRSMRILKAETKGLREDDDEPHGSVPLRAVEPTRPAVAYQGQQLYDAQGRPVQVPAVPVSDPQQPSAPPRSQA